ncbi:MAG: TIGR03668 family PPOX class F420-dependent oxidoreductase [Tepidiformaceae bacterium]
MLEAWQVALLEECRVARLAKLSAGGQSHLVPVCYALVGSEVAIPVDEKRKKPGRLARLRNIDRDARATLLIDRYEDDWTRLAWVRLECEARVLERGDERPVALAALRARYPQYGAMALEGLPLILLTVRRVVGWRAR